MSKKLILYILLLSIFSTYAQKEAKEILDQVSTTIKAHKTLYIDFTNSLDNKEENVHQITKGSASLKGDLYSVNMLGTITIFDGKKVHSINPEDEEVNISDPDEDVFTPAKFFSFYEKGYNFKMDKTENLNGRKLQYIKLTPIDSESDFDYVLLGVDLKSNNIQKIIQKGKNGTDYTLTIINFKSNIDLPNKLFEFNKSKYEDKGYIINEF